jgi:hypothetical protein
MCSWKESVWTTCHCYSPLFFSTQLCPQVVHRCLGRVALNTFDIQHLFPVWNFPSFYAWTFLWMNTVLSNFLISTSIKRSEIIVWKTYYSFFCHKKSFCLQCYEISQSEFNLEHFSHTYISTRPEYSIKTSLQMILAPLQLSWVLGQM